MHSDYLFRTITCSHCGHEISVPISCGNRFCDTCNSSRRQRIRFKIDSFVKSDLSCSSIPFAHLTLTVKSQPDLKEMVVYIVSSFRRLRNRQLWKKHVVGGAFVLEVTHNSNGWHAHLHVIIQSTYMPYEQLLTAWTTITSSTGVFIKRVPASIISHYLTKYITKTELDEEMQLEASEHLKGMRMFQPFGSWHKPIASIVAPAAFCGECSHSAWHFGNTSSLIVKLFGKDKVFSSLGPPVSVGYHMESEDSDLPF